jgi:hypothetical protein
MADAADQLARTPLPPTSWEEQEAIREELHKRLARFCGDAHALSRWRMRREIWEEMAAEAQRAGAPMPSPMPPRPPHWADKLPDDLRRRIVDDPANDEMRGRLCLAAFGVCFSPKTVTQRKHDHSGAENRN